MNIVKSLKNVSTTIAAVLLLATSNQVLAIVIDFENVAPTGGSIIPSTPYLEDNFLITSTPTGTIEGIFDSAASNVNTNGTDIFGWCGSCSGSALIITLAHSGGDLFDLLSFDFANLNLLGGAGATLQVTGNVNGGGSVTTSVTLQDGWMTANTAGFLNLTSVDFMATTNPTSHLAFDNLTVATSAVPEPSILALMSAGLFGLIRFGRRKKA